MDERALKKLRAWSEKNIRAFPWRESRDPYKVAVTELMLVRTKPNQVHRLWEDFFRRFPSLEALANAPESEIAEALSSLGLEWRARMVAHFGKEAWIRFGQSLPADADTLRQVPGMGEYVPEATAIIVKGHGTLPVDTGIARLLHRFYGLNASGELRRNREVLAAARNVGSCPRELFFTLIDFCAAVCTARSPRCRTCPLNKDCAYGRERTS